MNCTRCNARIHYEGTPPADGERCGTAGPFLVYGVEVEAPACLECASDAEQNARIVAQLEHKCLTRFQAGDYAFKAPPVPTALWRDADWIRFIGPEKLLRA